MRYCDLHTHTTFSDGKNTPEEMVLAAIARGMDTIGISDHSYTDFDESFCIQKAQLDVHLNTITALKEKYADRIRVLCGVEQDFYSTTPTDRYDYVIGSVHYVKLGEDYVTVDESPEAFRASVKKYFGGDPIAFAEAYFRNVAEVVERTGADIIGHFDLVSKFNRDGMFDERDPRYVAAWQAAADRLLATGKPFEINTGAISRGYKEVPYPSADMISYIKAKGGELVLSSDAHSTEGLCFEFDKWHKLLL